VFGDFDCGLIGGNCLIEVPKLTIGVAYDSIEVQIYKIVLRLEKLADVRNLRKRESGLPAL
jgi:hypothetical protein